MISLTADMVLAKLPYERLIPALRVSLAGDWDVPQRVQFDLGAGASTIVMPAWNADYLGTKIANIFPGNTLKGLPAVSSAYLLSDATTGKIVALIDGETLTARRTAAVSALAASYLSSPDADHLLLVGTGRIARELASAFSAVRPIKRVTIWGRSPERAAALAEQIAATGVAASVSHNLAGSVAEAQIIACATFSTEPLIRGAWLKANQHLSLIGGFRPTMREADSEAVARCYVVADTRSGVIAEAGDILTPIAESVIGPEHIRCDLFDLCRANPLPPIPENQPTLFKSVGHAAQDLSAALLCLEHSRF